MRASRSGQRARFLALVLAASACRMGEDYRPPEPELPASFVGAEGALAATPADEGRWWAAFGDPVLDELVRRALERNLDIAIAAQRILEARAAVGIVGGEARPRADLVGGALRTEQSTALSGGEFTPEDAAAEFSLGIDARWELDFFGQTARQVEATEAARDAEVESARGVLLLVLAEVARNYVELRGAEAELELLERELASQRETFALVGSRVRAGIEVEAAVERARALAATTESLLPLLAQRRDTHAHALAVLLGEWPGEIAQALEPGTEPSLPTPPDAIASGLPVDLLRRRPDVRHAERQLARASALSAQAVALLYPRISLGVAFGWESETLEGMFDAPSRAWSVGPSFLTPLFRGGILRWFVRARNAQEEQARLAYERALREALREVEDALSAWSRTRARLPALAAARSSQRAAQELVRERYAGGLEDYLGVLDSERGVLVSESALVRGQTAHALAAVALFTALGGGWEAVEGEAGVLAAARGGP